MAETRNLTARGLLPALAWMRAKPGRIALYWAINTILCGITVLMFPDVGPDGSAGSILLLASAPIFAAFLAAWALDLRAATLGLVALLAGMFVSAQLVWLAFLFMSDAASLPLPGWWVLAAMYVLITGLVVWAGYAGLRSRKRRAAAVALMIAVNIATFAQTHDLLWRLLPPAWSPTAGAAGVVPPQMPEADRLWEEQWPLVEKAIDGLEPRVPGTMNVYGMAVAAQGSQTLFSREAKFALKVIEARFRPDYRGGILFSNGAADLMRSPLAIGGNIGAVLQDIGGSFDPSRDVVIIYLTSHGDWNAALSTDLPDHQAIRPIWAGNLAAMLNHAKIRRRVVIVSACYSGTWIPALASDDTIVITAAAKDRTSFGCSDDRHLTYFGEAFLEGSLSKGASLQQAFERARKTVTEWEKREGLSPSLPQAFVGKNMRSFWSESPAGGRKVQN